VEGEALISHGVLASYATDAAREVAGVTGLAGRRGVRIGGEDGRVTVELHLEVAWGVSIPAVGAQVQQRVADYLAQMADVRPESVDVFVDAVGSP
jgi:uncharacterized alkaline shock family protein YloU